MQELLKKLIKFKTFDDQNEFDKCFDFIKDYLNGQNLYFKEYIDEGKKSLVISNTESKDLDIIFCGHLDVIPGKEEQFNPIVKDNIM